MDDRIVFNANLEVLMRQFPNTNLIGIREAAAFCGCDYRTLENRRDFPVIRLGNSARVPLIRFARWLTDTQGRG